MKLNTVIGLVSAGVAVSLYSTVSEIQEEIKEERRQHERYIKSLLEENEELEDRVDPNSNSHQAPVVFTATMRAGGHTLNQNEITLTCTNISDSTVDLGDFRANLWIAGVKSLKIIPANINSIRIPANSTVSFRFYASGSPIAIQNYIDCKKRLNIMYDGKDSSFMRSNTFIPLDKSPIELDLEYLWYWSGGEEECQVYGVPGSYRWKSAGWTAGTKAGYNAANESQQDKNPSYWERYDEQPIDEDE